MPRSPPLSPPPEAELDGDSDVFGLTWEIEPSSFGADALKLSDGRPLPPLLSPLRRPSTRP